MTAGHLNQGSCLHAEACPLQTCKAVLHSAPILQDTQVLFVRNRLIDTCNLNRRCTRGAVAAATAAPSAGQLV